MNYGIIKPYIEKKLVSEQAHPDEPSVRIFNYTQTCQFEGLWDDVTRQCRGLIMDISTNEVLARPFPKFFNYGEHITKGWPIPKGIPIVTEKLDGSLGIMYTLHRKIWIATRGSFVSDQAIWATQWFRNAFPLETIDKNYTHLFEIIYPENRIVVNYDFSGLVHLASIENKTGKQVNGIEWSAPIRSAKKIDCLNLEQLAQMDEINSEGFVVFYPKANMRMKIKFPEYVRLHRLVTGVSEIAIWEHLKDGNGLEDLLNKVPDEFFKWVKSVQNCLRADFAKIWGEAQMAVQMVQSTQSRKEQAKWIMKNHKNISGIIFSLLDNDEKRAVQAVWRMLRPRGAKGFKVDIDK